MFLAGAILVFSTIMKIQEMLTLPIKAPGFWESWEFFLIQIPLEMGLGIWLISGLFRKAAWLLSIFVFAGFICVTLTKAILGYESCGCFGQFHVNPWITLLAIDVPFFLAFLIFRPDKKYKLLPPPWPGPVHFGTTFAVYAAFFVVIMPVLIFNKVEAENIEQWVRPKIDANLPAAAANDINMTAMTTVEPNKIPDIAAEKPTAAVWPLLKNIDVAATISQGIWIVFMYHNDCPTCTECIPTYERYARDMQSNEDSVRFVFIEMPPYEPAEKRLVPQDTVALTGRLDESRKWIYATPVVTLLFDGEVLGAWDGSKGTCPTLDEILKAMEKW